MLRPALLSVALTAPFALLSPEAQAQQATGTAEDLLNHITVPDGRDGTSELISRPGASFLRVHFAWLDLSPGDRLEIRDGEGLLVETFEEQAGDTWSTLIHDDEVELRLFVTDSTRNSSAFIEGLALGHPEPEGVCAVPCGENVDCRFLAPEWVNREAVCRLHFTKGGIPFSASGWLIAAPDVLMTNWHNIDGVDGGSTIAEFHFECDACVGGDPTPAVAFAVDSHMGASKLYDWALLDLEMDPATDYGILSVNVAPPSIGEPCYVIHHPMGAPKAISDGFFTDFDRAPDTCPIGGVKTPLEVEYSAGTSPGSSGSPVFNSLNHNVEALHHCGLGACSTAYGIPMNLIVPQIEPLLVAAGKTYSFVHTPFPPCNNAVPYCTAKINSKGCYPIIDSSGCSGASHPEPFTVFAAGVINNKSGLLFFGFGPAAIPFQGGTLCVAPPVKRTAPQSSTGGPPPNDCSGIFTYDFNALIQSGTDPDLVPGVDVFCQWWYRDPASPSGTGFTDALVFNIAP